MFVSSTYIIWIYSWSFTKFILVCHIYKKTWEFYTFYMIGCYCWWWSLWSKNCHWDPAVRSYFNCHWEEKWLCKKQCSSSLAICHWRPQVSGCQSLFSQILYRLYGSYKYQDINNNFIIVNIMRLLKLNIRYPTPSNNPVKGCPCSWCESLCTLWVCRCDWALGWWSWCTRMEDSGLFRIRKRLV